MATLSFSLKRRQRDGGEQRLDEVNTQRHFEDEVPLGDSEAGRRSRSRW